MHGNMHFMVIRTTCTPYH